MEYLTEEEYNEMGFTPISKPFEFEALLLKSSSVIDNITNRYYQFNSFEDDVDNKLGWRVEAFKRAIGTQIEYFVENKAMTTSGINSKPLTQQIGRTSIGLGSKGQTTRKDDDSIVCPDVYLGLEGTGLLYRGVRSC